LAKIEVKNLFKVFGPESNASRALEMAREGVERSKIQEETQCVVAVNDVSFSVEEAKIFVIMGLSGSGKSTLLRCINRLIEPSSGEISIDGTDIMALEPNEMRDLRKQKTAMVFQHFGLLDHRTVLGNVAFGLELQDVALAEREEKALETLKLVGLEKEADAMINELSGGMQQRVGLARALATEAEILLMDEAFSALDPLIRTRMQREFLELQEDIPKTILFITHDLGEALALGDSIAIMKDGAVVQIGTPEEIIIKPANDYVASFVENVDRSRVISAGTAATTKQPEISPADSVEKALSVMREAELDYAFVVENEDIKGAVRLRDAEREAERGEPSLDGIILPIDDKVDADESLISILAKAAGKLSPLPVVDGQGQLVGAVTKDMLLQAVAGERQS